MRFYTFPNWLINVCVRSWGRLVLVVVLISLNAPAHSLATEPGTGSQQINLETLWEDLAVSDSGRAYQTIWKLVDHPVATLELLDKNLKPIARPKLKEIRTLVHELGHKRFSKRIQAFVRLKKMGVNAKSELEIATTHPSPEVRNRVQILLGLLAGQGLPPEELRVWRSIQVLEYIGTDSAKVLLNRLADGPPKIWQTEEALAALRRLEQKHEVGPVAEEVTRKVTLTGHTGRIYGVAFSPDGRMVASAGSDGMVKLWDIGAGREITTLRGHSGAVWSVSFTPDGKLLSSSGSDGNVILWDLATFQETTKLSIDNRTVYSAQFHVSGKLLVSAGSARSVMVWNPITKQRLNTFEGHTGTVWGVAISADGKTVASASSDKTVACGKWHRNRVVRFSKATTSTCEP